MLRSKYVIRVWLVLHLLIACGGTGNRVNEPLCSSEAKKCIAPFESNAAKPSVGLDAFCENKEYPCPSTAFCFLGKDMQMHVHIHS